MKKRNYLLRLLLTMAMCYVAAFTVTSCSSEDDNVAEEITNNNGNNGGSGGKENNIPVMSEITYQLSSTAVVVPATTANAISDVDEDAKTLTMPLTASEPQVGQTLIFNTPTAAMPDGLLAKVKSVTETETGYEITYEDAELGDAFESIDIPEQYIPLYDKVERVVDADGNELSYVKEAVTRASGKNDLKLVLPEKGWTIDGVDVTPKMTIDMAMRYVMQYGDGAIDYACCKVDADVTLGADMELKKKEGTGFKKEIPLATVYFAAIPVGPVVITPFVDLTFVVKAEGKITLEASISYKRTAHSELIYQKGQGLNLKVYFDPEEPDALNYNIGPKLEGGVSYGLSMNTNLGLYGKTFALGASMDIRKKETISAKLDLAALTGGFEDYLLAVTFPTLSLLGSKWDFLKWEGFHYGMALTVQGAANLTLLGKKWFDFELPEWSLPLESYPIMPQVKLDEKDFIKYDDSKKEMTVTLHHPQRSLFDFDTEYRAEWVPVGGSADAKKVVDYFNFDDSKRHLLEADTKNVTSVAVGKLQAGQNYVLNVYMSMFDGTLEFPVFTQELNEVVLQQITFEGTIAYSSPDYRDGEKQYDTDFKRLATAYIQGYKLWDFRTTQTGKTMHVDVMYPEDVLKARPDYDPNYKMFSFDIDDIDAIATKQAKIKNFKFNFTFDYNFGSKEQTYPRTKEHWEYDIATEFPMTGENTWELTASKGITFNKYVYTKKVWEYDNPKDYTECTGTKTYDFKYEGAVYLKITLKFDGQVEDDDDDDDDFDDDDDDDDDDW